MKKLITIFLAIILVMSFTACDQNPGVETTNNSTTANMNETNVTEDMNELTSATDGTDASDQTNTETTESPQNAEVGDSPTDRDDKNETNSTEGTSPTEPHVHKYSDETADATCTNDGYTTHTCTCGDSYKDSKVGATGHSFGEWNTTKEPTITKTGTAERKCSKCGATETKTLGKLVENHTHSYTESVTTQPTCAKTGVKTFTCSCGDKYTEDVAKISHDYKSSVVNATCVNGGYTTYKCTMCGDSYTNSYTNATGHIYVDSVIAPTCTIDGYTKHTCSKCGNSYTDTEVAATGHNYSVTSDTATCAADGTKTETCSKCNDTKASASKATGHMDTKTETKEATCYSQGYTKVVCNTCGTTVSETTTPRVSHSKKTMRVSDAATLCDKIWMEKAQYKNYTDWLVEACEYCGSFKEDSMYFAYTEYEAAIIMLGYVNSLRESVYGTDKYNLTLDSNLIALAKRRSEEISTNYYHVLVTAGENICNTSGANIYEQFVAWCNSNDHYENMIRKDWVSFCYAIYFPYGNRSTAYGVQLFNP